MYDGALHHELIELRQMVEALSRRVDQLFAHAGLREVDDGMPAYVKEATRLVRENRINEAVRVVVEHTAVGLAEARAMVEDLALRIRTGARTSREAERQLSPHAGVIPPSTPPPAPARKVRDYDVVGPAARRRDAVPNS